MTKNIKLSHKLAKFEGVFCSGFLIPDQAMITALSLIFEKVHFLNQLEYVIELSKKYTISAPAFIENQEIKITPTDPATKEEPLYSLSLRQKRTVYNYLYFSDQFFMNNALLFPKVFCCSLLAKGEILSAKLIEKGVKGRLNLYEVKRNPLVVSVGGQGELKRLISEGKIPIVGGIVPIKSSEIDKDFSATQIATALAIKSIAMILPGTKEADSETILEAREKLKDHLPPFWASMLKLSAELSERLNPKEDEIKLQREVDYAVSTIIRPALIELVNKMEKERKQWFYKILSPLVKGLRIIVGNPSGDLASLISSSLTLGANASLDIVKQLRKVEALKQNSGLTYIIELHKVLNKPKHTKSG